MNFPITRELYGEKKKSSATADEAATSISDDVGDRWNFEPAELRPYTDGERKLLKSTKPTVVTDQQYLVEALIGSARV